MSASEFPCHSEGELDEERTDGESLAVVTVPFVSAAVQRIDGESEAQSSEHELESLCTGEAESVWPWILFAKSVGVRAVIGDSREICTAGCESKLATVATRNSVAVWTAVGKSGCLQALDGESP